jgi:hypothetical protein
VLSKQDTSIEEAEKIYFVFFLALLLDPEDGADMFLRNVR